MFVCSPAASCPLRPALGTIQAQATTGVNPFHYCFFCCFGLLQRALTRTLGIAFSTPDSGASTLLSKFLDALKPGPGESGSQGPLALTDSFPLACKAGKVLWTANLGSLVNYVSGKFIYSVYSYHADDDEDSAPNPADSILARESVLSIKRINPKNGHVLWEHVQPRAPYDIQFDHNTIRLVFKKEVQVLKFLAL